MPINSRQKGAAGEREFAHFVTEKTGWAARRGQQHSGSSDSPDVVVDEWVDVFHGEVKRVQALNLKNAYAQAQRDAGEGVMPIVFHRRNGEQWMATLSADELFQLMDAYLLLGTRLNPGGQ